MSPIFSYKLEYQDKSRPLRPISPIHRLLLKIASAKIVSVAAVQFSQTDNRIGRLRQKAGFSQAVSIPAHARVVITAGQAGLDLRTGRLVETSVEDQISAAFDCVDAALRSAGVKDGLASAHKMVSYLLDVRDEPLMMEIWRRRYPERRPTWTAVGVASLCIRGMVIEIQGEATIL
jgi:enamine deaminase RidA (YjgF/YER057c/UK114 family)